MWFTTRGWRALCKITYLVKQVAGFDRVDRCSGSLREAMSATGFVAGLIIHTKLATTRVDGDRDLWGWALCGLLLYSHLSLLLATQHCEWNGGIMFTDVGKACFTWRREEGWMMVTLIGFWL